MVQAHLDYSLLFEPVITDAKKLEIHLGILGKSFEDIKNAFLEGYKGSSSNKLIGGFSGVSSLFKITQDDIDALKAYNAAIDGGTTAQKAFNDTMVNASPAAKNLVNAANGSKVSIDSLSHATLGARTKLLALHATTMAFNVLLSMGLSLVIQGMVKSTKQEESHMSDTRNDPAIPANQDLQTVRKRRKNGVENTARVLSTTDKPAAAAIIYFFGL